MTPFDWQVLWIAIVVSASCALAGSFLVLRQLALMSDAISHSILLGIVLGFFWAGDLASPWLIGGATLTGVATVFLVELLHKSERVKEDAAIALVFPAFFSLGVLLIGMYAGNAHLDVDAVLLGEISLAPLDRMVVFGIDIGARSLVVMSAIGAMILLFVLLFYKELQLSTFDAGLSAALGFTPAIMHYGLMTVVSVTAVGAFDAVGSILVVALMIVPACAAQLLTHSLGSFLVVAPTLAVISSVLSYPVARVFDVSVAGMMATGQGVMFLLIFVLSPSSGLISSFLRQNRNRRQFAVDMLLIHLLHHQGTPRENIECRLLHLEEHLGWDLSFATATAHLADKLQLIDEQSGRLSLTTSGRLRAEKALLEIPG